MPALNSGPAQADSATASVATVLMVSFTICMFLTYPHFTFCIVFYNELDCV